MVGIIDRPPGMTTGGTKPSSASSDSAEIKAKITADAKDLMAARSSAAVSVAVRGLAASFAQLLIAIRHGPLAKSVRNERRKKVTAVTKPKTVDKKKK